jgi:Protein of unknown function (DUF4058)
MHSPFPGMDPFVEGSGLWPDFRAPLITGIFGAVNGALPSEYLARPCVWFYRVFSSVRTRLDPDFPPIEVLSRANKRRHSVGWRKSLRQRREILRGKANLVEIDLLRGGDRMPMLDSWPSSPYVLLVAREERAPRCQVWPASFDRPLPVIPVPLSRPDPDLTLDLQPLIAAIYARGRYGDRIDYSRPLKPPLTADQVGWLEGQLQGRPGRAKPKPTRAKRPRRPRE